MYYYLSLGSNIDPEHSAVEMVRWLCRHFGSIGLYPFRYTQPEGIESDTAFVNTLAIVRSEAAPAQVKQWLNEIEAAMGRDRSDPLRSIKSRSADLDILGSTKALTLSFFAGAEEGYVQQCWRLQGRQPDLSAFGLASYERAATVDLDAGTGQIRVVEDECEGLKHGREAPLTRQQGF